MPDINITVAHKVAVSDTQSIVCDNSDYTVHWTLDDEWSAYDTKTMRTIYMDGTYEDKVFSGDTIALPVVTVPGVVQIGLFAGDIRTSRVAILRALPSVRSAAGAPVDPTPDVYDQLMELIKGLGGVDPDDIAKAVADYLAAHPIEETDPTVPEWAKAAITGATVGQIAKIAAVDTDGVPTAWSPVDMPSGEGTSEASWHAWDNIIVPEGGLNAFDFTTLASGEKLPDHQIKGMFIYSPFISSATESEQTATLTVNGDYIFNLETFGRAGSGYLRILLMVENGQLVVRYYKRDTDDFVVFPATTVALNSQDLHPFGAISKGSVSVIGYGKTLKVFNQIQSVRIESSGQVLKGVEFDVQVLY